MYDDPALIHPAMGSRPHLSPTDRLDEVAHLLALGYLRLQARRQAEKGNEPNHLSEFGLDFRAERSVSDTDTHADRERR